jgi:thiamine kinase-like enzyme
MRERARDGAGFTLVHGDLNPGNILAPTSGSGRVYLIDRQPFDWCLRCWIGASDLAFMMVLFWTPAERRQYQEAVLRQYQRTLAESGVEYGWDSLSWDYRFSVAQCLEFAVEWLVLPADRIQRRTLWLMQLERSMEAFLELNCAELWFTPHPERVARRT